MTLATRPALQRILTDLDRQVLALVAEGHTKRQIGRLIGVSEDAVSGRLCRIYARLGVKNAPHAVAYAIRAGLLPTPNREAGR